MRKNSPSTINSVRPVFRHQQQYRPRTATYAGRPPGPIRADNRLPFRNPPPLYRGKPYRHPPPHLMREEMTSTSQISSENPVSTGQNLQPEPSVTPRPILEVESEGGTKETESTEGAMGTVSTNDPPTCLQNLETFVNTFPMPVSTQASAVPMYPDLNPGISTPWIPQYIPYPQLPTIVEEAPPIPQLENPFPGFIDPTAPTTVAEAQNRFLWRTGEPPVTNIVVFSLSYYGDPQSSYRDTLRIATPHQYQHIPYVLDHMSTDRGQNILLDIAYRLYAKRVLGIEGLVHHLGQSRKVLMRTYSFAELTFPSVKGGVLCLSQAIERPDLISLEYSPRFGHYMVVRIHLRASPRKLRNIGINDIKSKLHTVLNEPLTLEQLLNSLFVY